MRNTDEHKAPGLADKLAGKLKRGVAEIVGSHELQQEGLAQEHEGNPSRAEAEARAAVDGDATFNEPRTTPER